MSCQDQRFKRRFAVLAVVGLALVNLIGITGTAGVNRAPEFDANIENQLVFVSDPENNYSNNESQTLSFYMAATDPDGDVVTVFPVVMPPGMTFVEDAPGNGTFTWAPDFFQAGDWIVTARASDGSAWTEHSVTVRVADVARGPAFVPPTFYTYVEANLTQLVSIGSTVALEEGDLVFGFVHAVDPDGDTLSYSAQGLPAGASFDPSTRMFSWRPGTTQGGAPAGAAYTVTFNATDGGDYSAENATFSVSNINNAPFVSGDISLEVVARQNLVAQEPFDDIDISDPLVTDSLVVAPSASETTAYTYDENATLYTYETGVTLNGTSGDILWSPTDADVGVHYLLLEATDAYGATTPTTVAITVLFNELPVLSIEGPALVDLYAEAAFSGFGSFDPEDAGDLTYEWTLASDIDPANHTATLEGMNVTHAFSTVGNHTVTLTVTDADGKSDTTSAVVMVDDIVEMDLEVIQDSMSLISAVGGHIRLATWDGVGIANTPIAIQVFHHPQTGDPELVSEFTVTTDENGEVNFVVPRDEGLFNRLGEHSIHAATSVADSLNGDVEFAEAEGTYEVGIL